MNKKILAAVVSTLAFGTVSIAGADEAPAPKAEKAKGKKAGKAKAEGDKPKEGGEKACGGDKGCGGKDKEKGK